MLAGWMQHRCPELGGLIHTQTGRQTLSGGFTESSNASDISGKGWKPAEAFPGTSAERSGHGDEGDECSIDTRRTNRMRSALTRSSTHLPGSPHSSSFWFTHCSGIVGRLHAPHSQHSVFSQHSATKCTELPQWAKCFECLWRVKSLYKHSITGISLQRGAAWCGECQRPEFGSRQKTHRARRRLFYQHPVHA